MESCPRKSTARVEARQGKVHLPLAALDVCKVCQKSSQEVKLRCCLACGEAIYCSPECQTKDWQDHKPQCGQTDRIDLQSFFPFLGYLAKLSHYLLCPTHPALLHQVVEVEDFVNLPNGQSARLVGLGHPVPQVCFPPTEEWWPTAPTPSARIKLARRIITEGYLLPIVLSICIALVSEMYTTTALRKDEPPELQTTGRRRVRLTHKSSPIADFGIVKGSARVVNTDRLAYFSMVTHDLTMGQDPNDHYRIYFKTLAGHEYYLDVGMYTFDFNEGVDSSQYSPLYNKELGLPKIVESDMVSAIFTDMEPGLNISDQMLFEPRERFSVLRDPKIQAIVQPRSGDSDNYITGYLALDLMDRIAGKRCGIDEKQALKRFVENDLFCMQLNMKERDYLKFPKEPRKCVDQAEPDDCYSEIDKETSQKLSSFWATQSKKLKKHKISKEKCREEAAEMMAHLKD